MPERPLIIMPKPTSRRRPRGHGGGSLPPAPLMNEARKKTFDEKFDAAINLISTGVESEAVLVIETIGKIQDIQNAASRISGLEWLAEVDRDEIEIVDDWYSSEEEIAKAKKAGGRLYLMSSNAECLREVKRLWDQYKPNLELDYGYGKWAKLFEYLHDVRYWNEHDRLAATGVLDYFRDEVKTKRDSGSSIFFDIELHFRKNNNDADAAERKVRQSVEEINGVVLTATRIEQIGFHAMKISCPVGGVDVIAQNWDNANKTNRPRITSISPIKYLRPVPQQLSASTEIVDVPMNLPSVDITDKPQVIALLDGYPMANHQWLDSWLVIDDLNGFFGDYEPHQMKHGTMMASLICHGDFNNPERKSLDRQIRVVPIMRPEESSNGKLEKIPPVEFPEDVVERAVRHMLNETDDAKRSVRVINLSIGNLDRIFAGEMSSWARLLDWLSWEYKVLFVVSAGNYRENITIPDDADSFFENTIKQMAKSSRIRKILSPAESMNSVTVGAINADHFSVTMNDARVNLLGERKIAAEYSRLGGGYRKSIKPEILVAGGRQMYVEENRATGLLELRKDVRLDSPGQMAASVPVKSGETNRASYSRGTSNAAALTTHAAGLIYEVIDELRSNESGLIPENYDALLIKALLVHGAGWRGMDEYLQVLKNDVNSRKFRRYIAQYLGYGAADFSRVMECTASRVTTLGFDNITTDENHLFSLPIPPACKGIHYNLIVTLAYFTPINPFHFNYRVAKVFFECPLSGGNRQDTDFQQVRGGTVQHEIFDMDSIDDESVEITIQCDADAAKKLDGEIPYALALTLDAEQETDIDIYNEIKAGIEQRVPTQA